MPGRREFGRCPVPQSRGTGITRDVVETVGHVLVRGTHAEVQDAQAVVAAMRDQFRAEYEQLTTAPIPTSHLGRAYVAGALWAANELLVARLDQFGRQLHMLVSDESTRRARITSLVLDSLSSTDPQTPSSLLEQEAFVTLGVRRDEISRALSDLINQGLAQQTGGVGDRRRKFYISALSPTVDSECQDTDTPRFTSQRPAGLKHE